MISENGRFNRYKLNYNNDDEIKRLVQQYTSPEDAKVTKMMRETNANKYGSTKDKAIRGIGAIPIEIVIYFNKKFPGFWNNTDNVRDFLRIHRQFSIAEKI